MNAPTDSQPSTFLGISTNTLLWGSAYALLILGTLLRLRHYLAAPSFWFDEVFLLLNIMDRSYGDLMRPLDEEQSAPLLYVWALRGLFEVFGCNEWSMRLPALVGGIGMVWLAWPWARQCLDWPGRLCLLALAATSLHGIIHADEVKPYALDGMWTILILYVGSRTLQADRSPNGAAILVGLGMLGPWVSFPSVFALFGVGIAWLVTAIRQRDRSLALGLLAYGILGLASCGLYWWLIARHQDTTILRTWWAPSFWDFSSPTAALVWPVNRGREMADYATTGFGIPFILVALFGFWSLACRSSITAWMVAGLALSALLLNAMRIYPLDGRVGYFMAPVLWLVLASAVDFFCERLPGRWKCLPVVVFLSVMTTEVARTCRAVVWVRTIGDFRSAIDHVHEHWRQDDLLWQWEPRVYGIYHGKERLNATLQGPWEKIPRAVPGQRLWMIAPPDGNFGDGTTWIEVQQHVAALNWRRVELQPFHGLELLLFEPVDR